ncbi:MAG: flagellar filament capping protein FliD [Candidatus Tectomicrobia bacterium]|uniref:Filament cap protein n=1 Tax=Tectimicrobiota bacterium TaxID=2528274 RepID=A0A932GN93_UNCTE|nr:flagellar filament capping protein FliD [Candidatus Tectomicrobia bacterium]
MASTSSISGLASGIDWANIVDQIIAVEHRRIDVVIGNQNQYNNKLSEWKKVNTQLLSLRTKADTLRTADTFNVFQNTVTGSSSTDPAKLLSVSASTEAAPGVHTIEMSSTSTLAQARKVSSKSYSSSSTALSLSGDILINGKAINIASTDTLSDIKSKINAANSGSSATGVTATLLTVSSTDNRLVLTSDVTGLNQFSILDASTGNVLQSLGITNSTTSIKNATSNGALSDEFSSSDVTIRSLLGLNATLSSTTVNIGGNNVTINLDTDTSSVVSTTEDGVTKYQLKIENTTSFTDSNNILEALGVLAGSQSSVNELQAGSVANQKTSAAGGGAVTDGTQWNQINTGGDANNIALNDTITITGTKHDGTAVSSTFTIANLAQALNAGSGFLETIETAFGGGAAVDAYISDGTDGNTAGQIVVKDLTAGDSQLTVSLVANNEGGGSLNFGTVAASTQGYSMQVTAGQDANVKVNGVTLTRSSNTITDAIDGLTLNLLKIEAGTTLTLNVSRDTAAIQASVQSLLDDYNSFISYVNTQFTYDENTKSSGILGGDTTLSSVKFSTISLLPTTLNAFSLIGINSDKTGLLSIDSSDFLSSLQSDFNGVKRIFVAEGTTTSGEVTYLSHTTNSKAGDYAVNVTQVATQAATTGVKSLLSGIGAGQTETLRITDTLTGRIATVALNGDAGENGSSIDNIVNAVNSEFQTQYAQKLVGSVANVQISDAQPITSNTEWSDIDASLQDGDVISFTGTYRTGQTVSGSYTISDTATDTAQGFLSAVQTAFNNEVSATINASGKLVITDVADGDSNTSISITEPTGGGRTLDFGTVTTSNSGGVVGRYALEITASKDGSNQLVLTHNLYGSANGFTIAQVSNPGTTNKEILIGSQANTQVAPPGVLTSLTAFDNITGYTANTSDTITISGKDHSGTTITPVVFSVHTGAAYKTVQDFLTAIEGAFSLTAGSATVDGSGKIVITDSTTGSSQLAMTLTPPTGLNFGTFASQNTGLSNGSSSGQNVAGTINGEAATGVGQVLTGDEPPSEGGTGELLYRELDSLTDPLEGYVTTRIDGLQDTVTDLQTQIDAMEAQLALEKNRLTNQFIVMESVMSRMKTLSNWLAQQTGSLTQLFR